MAGFTSILDPGVGATVSSSSPPPDVFADLHLDQILTAVTAGYGDSDIASIFCAPLHDLRTVQYRQQVFGDLEDEHTRSSIQKFVDGMRAMRGRLNVARNAWHRLQRQGCLIAAIESYCHTMELLRDELAHTRTRSSGVKSRDVVCDVVV